MNVWGRTRHIQWFFWCFRSAAYDYSFYRVMHYSGIELHVVCLSVCPLVSVSVTLVDQDHTGWKSWKPSARTISPIPSLFVAQRPSRGTWGILRRLEVGWGKVACWSTKAAISLKRVKIEEKLLWRAYRKSQTLFRAVPSPTPYGPLYNIGVHKPNPKLQSLLSQEQVKLRTANLADTFTGSIRTKAH